MSTCIVLYYLPGSLLNDLNDPLGLPPSVTLADQQLPKFGFTSFTLVSGHLQDVHLIVGTCQFHVNDQGRTANPRHLRHLGSVASLVVGGVFVARFKLNQFDRNPTVGTGSTE